jgi:trigger factor
MQSQVSEISPVLVEIKVQVPWEDVQKGVEDGLNRAQRTATLKGFRAGKAPKNLIKQYFGGQVKADVVSKLVERGIISAVQEHKLPIVSTPEVEPNPHHDGEPLTFTAKVEVRPKIENIVVDGLEVMKANVEIKTDLIDRELDRLRQEHATVETPAEARPAKSGDLLTIDYKVELDGVAKADLNADDRQVELGAGRLLPEFDVALIGANVGDTKPVIVKFADDHQAEELRGKTAHFQVNVKEIKQKNLPELDDEFAKDCGDFENLEALKADIRKKLEDNANQRIDASLREQVVERLVDKNPIPVPRALLMQEEHHMIDELTNFMKMTGQPLPSHDDMHKQVHDRSERKVRAALLLWELARQEKLETTDADVEARLTQIAARTGKHIAKVRVDYQGERREGLKTQLLEGKVLDYLLSKAIVKDAPAEESKTENA